MNCRGLRDELLARATPVASRFELSGFPLKILMHSQGRMRQKRCRDFALIGEIDWSAKVSREVLEAPAEALIHVR